MKRLFVLLLLCSSAIAAKPCVRHPLCDELNDRSFACSESWSEKSCNEFVDTFSKLLSPRNCLENKTLVKNPEVFSCALKKGNMPIDLHYTRLAQLPFKKALDLFASKKLRDSMDGSIGEVLRRRSIETEKGLGKTVLPTRLIDECRQFNKIDFDSVDGRSEYRFDNYVIAYGEGPTKITNSKLGTECTVNQRGMIDSVSRVPGQTFLRYDSSEAGLTYIAFVDIKTCNKFYESSWTYAETITGQILYEQKINLLPRYWKSCSACWDKDHTACLRTI